MGERARLFLGLGLGPELGAEAMAPVERLLDPRAWRFPRSEGLHVTIEFLGPVPRDSIEDLVHRLTLALAGARAPTLLVTGPGAFPRAGAERVLWLGVTEVTSGRLDDLRQRALDALHRDPGGPMRPHVTVARPRKPPGQAPAAFFDLEVDLQLSAPEVALFESQPVPHAPPVYRALATFPLAP